MTNKTTETEAKVHPMDRWRKKKELATTTIKFDGQEIKIRELSGKEKDKFVKFTNNAKAGFFVWDRCINQGDSAEWVLFEEEFLQMYDKNSAEMSVIIHECLNFSGLNEEAEALLEKE